MAFDGFTLKAVTCELQTCLLDGKITKVYQPLPEEIILGIYSHGVHYALSCNISSCYCLHLTTKSKANPLTAPSFCMLLRKYLIGFKIKDISTEGLERVVTITLEGYNELNDLVTLKLIVELMGKHSNIILINQDNIIIDSLKHLTTFSGSYRNILPNSTYILPEFTKLDISKISASSTSAIYENVINKFDSTSLSSLFTETFAGVSKSSLDFSMNKLGITEDCTLENFKALLTYYIELQQKIENHQAGCLLFQEDYVLADLCFCEDMTNKDIPSTLKVNFFLDDYYFAKEQSEKFTSYRNSLLAFISKKLKKISKKLNGINEKIQECSKMEEYQLYGELLTNYLYKIEDKHTDHIVLENYYQQNELITIPLDVSLSPADNAKKYFKKYHKLKNTIAIVTTQKVDLEKEIDYLESIVYELQVAKSIPDIDRIYQEMEDSNLFSRRTPIKSGSKAFRVGRKLAPSKNSEKPQVKTTKDFLSYVIDGFTVLVGKNNQENDYLTTKIAKENDIWFHIKDMQGSHVILAVQQKEPSQDTINKVAAITAYYSKAKQSSKVPVDYTLAKYLKKPAKSKPGMVIYTNQKTVNVQPKLPSHI